MKDKKRSKSKARSKPQRSQRRVQRSKQHRSEEPFHLLADIAPAMLWVTDPDGSCSFLSRRWYEFTGQTELEGLGQNGFGWLEAVHPDDRERAGSMFQEANEKQRPFSLDYRLRRHDGEYRWAIDAGRPRFGSNGEFLGYIGSVLDITERKQEEQEKALLIEDLNRSHQYFRALFNWTPSAVGISTVAEGLLCDVNEGFSRLTGYTREELLGRTTLELGLWADPSQREIVLREIREQGFVHNREGLLRTKSGEIRSLMVTVESIQLGSTPCLIYLAHDITERKQAEDMRARLAAIVEGSDDAIFGTDVNGVITSWNQGAERLYGYAAQEAVGQSVTMIMPPERLNESPDILARLARGERVDHFETVRLRKNRSPVDISLTVSSIKDAAGRVIGASRVARDITERKRVEEALKQSEERFGSFLRSTDDGIVTLDRRGLIAFWNPGAEKLFGYAQDEVLGKPMTLLMPERFRERHERGIERASAAGHLTTAGSMFELVGLRKDGTEFPIELSLSSWSARDGVFFTGIVRDITERKQAEKILGESEERFRSLVGVITNVTWTADPKGQFVTPQEAYSRYTGASWEELRGRGWAQYIHPDDREQLVRSWKHAVATRAKYEASCREWHGPTQQWRRVIARGTPVLNLDGSVREWVGSLTDVNEQYETEAALRVSEEKYRTVFNSIDEGFCVVDMLFDQQGKPSDYLFLEINPMFEHLTGLRNAVGRTARELVSGLEEFWIETYGRVALTGESARFERYVEPMNIWFNVHASRMGDETSRRLAVVFTNITERKRGERLLAAEKKVLELIATGAELPDLLDTLMRETETQSTDGMLCSVLLADETGQRLLHGAAPSLPEAYNAAAHGLVIGPSAGSCGTAAFERKPVFVTDIAADPRWAVAKDFAAAHGLGACHSTPILSSQGRLLGTIAMYYRRPHNPGVHDRQLIERVTQLAGIAIERRQAEEALQISEHRFASFMDHLPGFAWIKDGQGRHFYVNRLFQESLVKRDDWKEKTAYELWPPEIAAHYDSNDQNDQKVLTSDAPLQTVEPYLQDGELRHALVSKFPIKDDKGMPDLMGGMALDITELKRAEAALRLAKFSVERAADAVYWVDPQAKILDVNEAASRMLGYSKDELCAMTVHDLNPDFQADMWPGFWAETQRRTTMVFESAHRAKDGRLIPIELSVNHLSYEGKEYHCAFVRDITERKRVEAALRESELRFRRVVDQTSVGVVQADPMGRMTLVNPSWCQMLGYSEAELLQMNIADVTDPASLPATQEAARRLAEGGPDFQIEKNYRRKDGSVFMARSSVSALRRPDGDYLGLIAVVIDITERIRAEAHLRQRDELITLMLNTGPGCIKRVAADGTLLSMNPTGLRLIDACNEQEVVGLCVFDLVTPEHRDAFIAMHRAVLAGQSRTLEFEILGLRGTRRWMQTYAVPLRNPITGCTEQLAVTHDITERKRTEAALKDSEDRYRSIFEKAVGGIFQTTLDGTYVAVNPALARIYGHDSPADTIATITDIASQLYVDPGRRDEFLRLMQTQEEVTGFESSVYRKDGSVMWISESARTLRDRAGTVVGYEGTVEDITERKRAEGRLRVTLDQVRALSGRLATVQEEERARIARELHDELGVKLTCLKIDLSRVMSLVGSRVRADLRAKLNDRVRSMVEQVDSTIVSLQQLVTQLRPALLDDLGLVAAIEWQSQDFQKRTGISCTCVTNADDIAMEPERATAVFRICQEALTNTARHAQATAAMITVTSKPDSLQMMVTDNGVGIPDTKISDRLSLGLLGMQERAAQCGGTVTIEGRPDKGTTVTLRLPVGVGQSES